MKEVTGGWSKLCKEALHDLYTPAAWRRMRWVGHMACMGEEKRIQGFGGNTWKKD